MIVSEKDVREKWCPLGFIKPEEINQACAGTDCMWWVYLDEEKGGCAIAISDIYKHRKGK